MKRLSLLAMLALVVSATFGAFASDVIVDDAIKLAKAKVGDDVMMAWADAQRPSNPINADAVIELKNASVPDRVISALVHNSAQAAVAQQAAPAVQSAPEAQPMYNASYASASPEPRYTYSEPVSYVSSPSYVYSGYSPYYYGGYPYYSGYYPRSYVSFGFGSYGHGWGGGSWGHGGSWGGHGGSGHHH